MLWQKERVKGELIYVKLMNRSEQKSFTDELFDKFLEMEIEKLFVKKNNSLALKSRKQGNGLFGSGNFREAVGVFNHTLAYTENDTEDLGICYANRSASFLKLREYTMCLVDIELAKKNNYPAHLMPKLDRRKIECEKQMAANGDASLQRTEPKLSFSADSKVPCFADALEVKFSDKYGNHIVTKRDLEIGQTVIIERAFVFKATDTFYLHCENCLKRTTNLIPCVNCVNVMFCSDECRNAANEKFHDVLCDIQHLCKDAPEQFLLMQSLVVAIRTFSTPEALMAAVEKFKAQHDKQINFDDPAKRKYFQFFKLRADIDQLSAHERDEIKKKAMEVIEILRTRSKVRAMFRTRKMTQFLSHLALHHMQIIVFNAYNASHAVCCPYESVLGIKECTLGTSFGIGVVPYSSQINHSCVPNICRIFLNDQVVFKVFRPIKAGDQLFISYLEPIKLMKPHIERAIELAKHYRFVCDCISCTANSPPFKVFDKQYQDVLSRGLLAILDGVPEKNVMNISPVSHAETRLYERAAVNFLRKNDHLHPTMETLKIQFLLMQIWFLLMR